MVAWCALVDTQSARVLLAQRNRGMRVLRSLYELPGGKVGRLPPGAGCTGLLGARSGVIAGKGVLRQWQGAAASKEAIRLGVCTLRRRCERSAARSAGRALALLRRWSGARRRRWQSAASCARS